MIDANFEYADSRWQDIFLHLKDKGFNVHSPGEKIGQCLSEYIVIKFNGSFKHNSFSTNNDLYTILCYVPKDRYSSLEPFIQRVKNAMKELEPMILPQGIQTPSYYDDNIQAHMVSIGYKNYKKIEGGI